MNITNFLIIIILVSGVIIGILGTFLLIFKEKYRHSATSTKLLEDDHDAKSKFVSFASHEIKKPLTTIKLTLKTLLNEELGPLTAQQKEFITAIYNETLGMETIARTFLDISKIDLHALEISLKPMALPELEKIVSTVVNKRQKLAQDQHILISYNAEVNQTRSINAEQTALLLCVENLVDNAIHYTPPGGKITVKLTTDEQNVIFNISDTGIGITEDDRQKIFHEFFRAENAKRFKYTGSGVGLYLCKKYIEGHGGVITFTSEEDKGTTFTFTIPLATGKETTSASKKI